MDREAVTGPGMVILGSREVHLAKICGEDRQRVQDQRTVMARDGTSLKAPDERPVISA